MYRKTRRRAGNGKLVLERNTLTMLNILFAFFLFGMLCVLCGKGIYRVYKYQQGFSPQEYALLVALSIGTLAAIYMGVNKLEG